MRYLQYFSLFLLLIFNTFADEIADIDARVAEIDVELTNLGTQISSIQTDIGNIQGLIDPINDAISVIDDGIDEKNALIDSKTDERDALPEGDPQIAVLQGEIDALVVERDQLLLDKQAQIDLKEPLSVLLANKQEEKDALLEQETGFNNEKLGLLENKRKILRRNRIDACPSDIRACMNEAGFTDSNDVKFRKELIEELDDSPQSRIKKFEAVFAAVQVKLDEAENTKNAKAVAREYIRNLDASTVADENLRNLIIMLQ